MVTQGVYPKVIHDAMPQFQLPEILRTPLQELCLTIKNLQLGEVATFLAKSLQPPNPLSVKNAIELLKTIGALNDLEELTYLGLKLYCYPAHYVTCLILFYMFLFTFAHLPSFMQDDISVHFHWIQTLERCFSLDLSSSVWILH